MSGDAGIDNNLVAAEQRPILKRKVKRPLAKFVIGSFAGMCACLFPRLIVFLNVMGQEVQGLEVFDPLYIICALIFSLFVGIVVMLLEWHVVSEPGKTFMMALSIPALFAGGFNTTNAIDLYASKSDINTRLNGALEKTLLIKTQPVPEKIKKILPGTQNNSSLILRFGGSIAHAGENSIKPTQFLAFRVKEKLFMILLDTSDSREEALEKAEKIRQKYNIQEIELIEFGPNKFGIVYRGSELPRSKALLEIYELKKNFRNLNPSLLPVPKK